MEHDTDTCSCWVFNCDQPIEENDVNCYVLKDGIYYWYGVKVCRVHFNEQFKEGLFRFEINKFKDCHHAEICNPVTLLEDQSTPHADSKVYGDPRPQQEGLIDEYCAVLESIATEERALLIDDKQELDAIRERIESKAFTEDDTYLKLKADIELVKAHSIKAKLLTTSGKIQSIIHNAEEQLKEREIQLLIKYEATERQLKDQILSRKRKLEELEWI